jgi:hypothetical protein
MKINTALVVIFIFLPFASLWGQNGYKSFSWDMSINNVKNEVEKQFRESDWGKEKLDRIDLAWEDHASVYPGLAYESAAYFRNSSVNWWPPETQHFRGNMSGSNSAIFSFQDDKLVSVTIWWNSNIGILQELIKTYSQGRTIIQQQSGSQITSRVWQSGDRYVVWVESRPKNPEMVVYINSSWINSIMDDRYRRLLESQKQAKSLLD